MVLSAKQGDLMSHVNVRCDSEDLVAYETFVRVSETMTADEQGKNICTTHAHMYTHTHTHTHTHAHTHTHTHTHTVVENLCTRNVVRMDMNCKK